MTHESDELGLDPSGRSADAAPETANARGTVRIAPAVLIELIELTVRAVPGVLDVQPRRRVERILPRAGYGTGDEARGKSVESGGVRVRIYGEWIDVDVSIVVTADANIMELSRLVQRTIGVAFGRMLDMTVAEVNVYVADIATSTTER